MILKELKRGLIDQNPILVLVLGLCPSLAISTSVDKGFGMGVAVTFVLACSNVIISLIRKSIPEKVRLPSYIIVIATFVTIVQLLMQAYLPSLDRQLGIFVPLIVVNCIILGRAEAFASKNNPVRSFMDGIVIGLGFTTSIVLISFIRELLGNNKLAGYNVVPGFEPMLIFVMAPGGFLVTALLIVLMRLYTKDRKVKQ